MSLFHIAAHNTILFQYQQQLIKQHRKMFIQYELHSKAYNLSFHCIYLFRFPSVFCLSVHLPISKLAANITTLKLYSRQKAWGKDQLVSGRTERVLPLAEETCTIARRGESGEKGAQNGIKERDFSLFCCTFFYPPSHTFQNTCSLISYRTSSLFTTSLLFDHST